MKSRPAPPIGFRSAESGARRCTGGQTRSQTDLAVAEVRPDGHGDPAVRLAGGRGAEEFLSHFTVFALACVVGYYVVWNVSHALHTPLMSVTNAISGIIVVGALLQIGHGGWVSFLSFIAVLIASINIFGGFTVTQRMLKMFRKN